MTDVVDAERMILERMRPFDAQSVPLEEAVDGVLREDVHAERDQPPFDRVTMDGIAIAHRDWTAGIRSFRIAGMQGAGAAPLEISRPGECVQIMTGAMLSAGADTIIPVERITVSDGCAVVQEHLEVKQRQFVHPQGSDRKAGSVLMRAGARIGPPEMAVLASAGHNRVCVARLPNVAVVSTGDELVDVEERIAPYQIRSSNDRAIHASLSRRRLAEVKRVRLSDDPDTLLDALRALHEQHDLLILSGGVSMGQYDFIPAVLERLGVEVVFHRIEQRPGRPMWFGVSGRAKPVFALPGNPVSTLVCLTRYVQPALRRALGLADDPSEWVRLAAPVRLDADLTYFMPVKLAWSAEGSGLAEPRPTNTSGDFVSLAGTDGFVELPRGTNLYPEGQAARLFRW